MVSVSTLVSLTYLLLPFNDLIDVSLSLVGILPTDMIYKLLHLAFLFSCALPHAVFLVLKKLHFGNETLASCSVFW